MVNKDRIMTYLFTKVKIVSNTLVTLALIFHNSFLGQISLKSFTDHAKIV
jgi:hypothetical protein